MDGLLAPDDMMYYGTDAPVDPTMVMAGPEMGLLMLPGSGVAEALGYAPDPFSDEYLPSTMDLLREGDVEGLGYQLLGLGGDALYAASPVLPFLAPAAAGAKTTRAAKLAKPAKKLQRRDLDPLMFGKKLPDTPLKDMNVDIEPISLLGERAVIKPEDLQGKVLMFGPGDRTGTGLLSGIDDVKFDEPIEMLGGRDYQLATPYGWASGESVISRILNTAGRAAEDFGTDDIVLAHSTMGKAASDFTEMSSSAMAELIKAAKVTKKDAKAFDDKFKTMLSESKAKEYPGVKSEKLKEFLAELPGERRNDFMKLMDEPEFRDTGLPAPSKVRFALTEPAQIEVPTFQTGMSFQPIDFLRGSIKDPSIVHSTYDTVVGKKNNQMPMQFERPVSTHDVYRDFEDSLLAEGKTVSASGKPLSSSARQYHYRMGNPKVQFVDQEMVDRLSGLLGY